MAIALFDTARPIAPLRDELRAAIDRVLDSGTFVLGPEVRAFEAEFASYLGVEHAIGVANGTDALTIALRAMGVGPGDDVVVPSFTFYASAEAIPPTGARPVFCDIDPETYCVTADTVRAALTPSTKAVIAVHLFGNVAPVKEIEALGIPVLEDAAQAAGRSVPTAVPGRSGLPAPTASTRPRTSARSATPARSRPRIPRWQSGRACSASTARGTRRHSSRSATTRASMLCRRQFCESSCRILTTGPRGAAERRRATSRRAWAISYAYRVR